MPTLVYIIKTSQWNQDFAWTDIKNLNVQVSIKCIKMEWTGTES